MVLELLLCRPCLRHLLCSSTGGGHQFFCFRFHYSMELNNIRILLHCLRYQCFLIMIAFALPLLNQTPPMRSRLSDPALPQVMWLRWRLLCPWCSSVYFLLFLISCGIVRLPEATEKHGAQVWGNTQCGIWGRGGCTEVEIWRCRTFILLKQFFFCDLNTSFFYSNKSLPNLLLYWNKLGISHMDERNHFYWKTFFLWMELTIFTPTIFY